MQFVNFVASATTFDQVIASEDVEGVRGRRLRGQQQQHAVVPSTRDSQPSQNPAFNLRTLH
jgi:hypothetical protein